MPELRGTPRLAARHKQQCRLEASVPDFAAADHDRRDPHIASATSSTTPFDREDKIGHQLQLAREIENSPVLLDSLARASAGDAITLKTHLGNLPAEFGGREMHANFEQMQATGRFPGSQKTLALKIPEPR